MIMFDKFLERGIFVDVNKMWLIIFIYEYFNVKVFDLE